MDIAILKALRLLRPDRHGEVSVLQALDQLAGYIERLPNEVVADDLDAGYNAAVDEVLDIIREYKKALYPHHDTDP